MEKYRDGDVKAAAALFRQAADIDPTVPPIIINRGFTHLQLYQQSPRSKEGIEAANLAIVSFKQYMQMPGLKPEQQQRARDYLLQTFVDARRYEEAVEYFKPQVERPSPDLEALTILGNIAKSIGKTEDSRKWLEKRVQANPKDTDGYVALAIMNWDVLCADSQCRTPLDQRRGNLTTMTPEQRFQKSNEGIDFLKKAISLSPQAPTPVIYANLLLRERSYAQPTDDLKRADLEQATGLMRLSIAMQKAATGASPTAPATGAGSPDAGTASAPADNVKIWAANQAVEAVGTINTTLPPPCPVAVAPPPAPVKRGKPPEPPPLPTGPCVPLSYLGLPAPAAATPATATAPGIPPAAAAPAATPTPAATPAPAATPTPAAIPAPPAVKPTPAAPPAAPKPAAPKPVKKVAAPAAAAPAPTETKPPAPAPAPAAPAPAPAADDDEEQ